MKKVYGYIRVSTKEQIDGASLPEQKRIIQEFADKNKLDIIHFYEENKTAAKTGRPLFDEMLYNLKNHKEAEGVIIHKIDRSARNLHDWADIGDLIDMNIDVFFAHESLDMNERGGRLSADIQAVMASDYVRNLRQETIKGLYGRLKQGIYPWYAPVGYINNGKGQVKTVCPIQSELIKQLFSLYISGEYNIRTLSKEMEKRGLRNKIGSRVCKDGISRILRNPFYIGLMKAKGKTFTGKHKPIIDPRIFNQAQMKIKGRDKKSKGLKHFYLFRKQIRCELCDYIMSGETQKGHIYYSCRTKGCPTKSVREDVVERYVKNILKTISLSEREINSLKEVHSEHTSDWLNTQKKIGNGYMLQVRQLEIKEQKLIDMYLEDAIDKSRYSTQREEILIKQQEIKSRQSQLSESKEHIFESIDTFLELCKTPINTYVSGIQEEKRELLEIITSNLVVNRRKVSFTMVSPFSKLANRDIPLLCVLRQDANKILYRKIIYTDKNTSSIVPKRMNARKIKDFYQFLLKSISNLSDINKMQKHYEIPTNNTDSQCDI